MEEELNKKWEIHKVVQEAINKAHTEPAPRTLSMLDDIKKTLAENYSKRELDEHFMDVKGKFDEQNVILKDLVSRVGVQNGRVGKLEGKFNGVALAGSCAIVLIGIIMSLVVYSFKLSQENLKNTILLEIGQDME